MLLFTIVFVCCFANVVICLLSVLIVIVIMVVVNIIVVVVVVNVVVNSLFTRGGIKRDVEVFLIT